MKFTVLSLIFLLAQLSQNQQSQPVQQTGSIEGQIVRFGSADGIARARVTISLAQGASTPKAVTADTEGKFAFRELGPGSYRLTVTRDGFVAAEYGQKGPSSSGVPVTLADKQQMKDVRIAMTQTGTISGRVINRYGEPSGNATVQALKYTYQEGRRVLTTMQSVRTNDLGEYRLFWLTPGQYIVSAQPVDAGVPLGGDSTLFFANIGPGGRAALPALGTGGVTRIVVGGPAALAGMPPPPPPPPMPGGTPTAENTEISLPVYFPNTTEATKAAAIDLRSGATYGGVDLTVAEARATRIRGQVFSGGQPVRGAQVSIYAKSPLAGFNIRSSSVNDNGGFEFRGLAPGTYELIATINGAPPAAMILGTPLGEAAGARTGVLAAANANTGPRMAARLTLDVVSSDIDNVTLTMDTGFNVNGRVSFDGRTGTEDPALANVRVQFQTDPNIPPLVLTPVNPAANGTFAIAGVTPGDYRLSVSGLGRNVYVKSARLGSSDVLNGSFRLDGDPRGTLEIVFGSNPGTLDATVRDERNTPVTGVTVVLVPEATAQKRFDIYRNATTDSSGRIHLDGVVPGNYRLYAWEDIESNAWTDVEIMRGYESRGAAVRIDEGGRATTEVKVIPYKLN